MPLTAANNTQLDVVDEDDVIIDRASRVDIHAQGLLHREVHIWFVTPNGEIIFQKRTPKKDTFPGLLDATVGGHVELGQSYEEAALREVQEESGFELQAKDLQYLGKYRGRAVDAVTGNINNVQRAIYGYRYSGTLEQLVIEEGAGAGFIAIPYSELVAANADISSQLISVLLEPEYFLYFDRLIKLSSIHES